MVFYTILSNIDKFSRSTHLLMLFGDLNVHHKSWLILVELIDLVRTDRTDLLIELIDLELIDLIIFFYLK